MGKGELSFERHTSLSDCPETMLPFMVAASVLVLPRVACSMACAMHVPLEAEQEPLSFCMHTLAYCCCQGLLVCHLCLLLMVQQRLTLCGCGSCSCNHCPHRQQRAPKRVHLSQQEKYCFVYLLGSRCAAQGTPACRTRVVVDGHGRQHPATRER